jgi:hypothetical protein
VSVVCCCGCRPICQFAIVNAPSLDVPVFAYLIITRWRGDTYLEGDPVPPKLFLAPAKSTGKPALRVTTPSCVYPAHGPPLGTPTDRPTDRTSSHVRFLSDKLHTARGIESPWVSRAHGDRGFLDDSSQQVLPTAKQGIINENDPRPLRTVCYELVWNYLGQFWRRWHRGACIRRRSAGVKAPTTSRSHC